MARWWEWDEGTPKVPEQAPDSAIGAGVVAGVFMVLAFIVGLLAFLFRAFTVSWWAFGVLAVCFVITRFAFHHKPSAPTR